MTVLHALSIYSVLAPFITGLILCKSLSRDGLLIWLISAAGTLPQLLKDFSSHTEYLDGAYNLYLAAEYVLTFFLFHKRFIYKKSNRFFLFSNIIYVLLVFLVIIFNGISQCFLYEWICLNSFVYSLWIVIVILEQYQNENPESEIGSETVFFWFLVGTFIYSLCTFMVFAFWDFIKITSKGIADSIKAIHSVFNILLYLCFTIGLCFEMKRGKIFKRSLVQNI